MQSCLRQSAAVRLLTAVMAISSMVMPGVSFAKDASLPYRNLPGFQCHRWNWMGECSDWSYYNPPIRMTAPPAYGGTTNVRPTYPVYRCNNPTVDCTGSVSVRATASPNPIGRGDMLTYSIYVRNDDSQGRTVNVRAYLDSNSVSFESATYGGYSDGNVVRWNEQRIGARMSRTLILRVRVRSDATLTEPVILRLQADRSSDSVSTNIINRDVYYDNATRYTNDGVYVRTGHPPRYRKIVPYTPQYYYDNNGYLHYRATDPSYQCDQHRYVCQ